GFDALLAWWLRIARRQETSGAAGAALPAFPALATLAALASRAAALSDGHRRRTLAVAVRRSSVLCERRHGRPGERDRADAEPKLWPECHDAPPKAARLKTDYACHSRMRGCNKYFLQFV